MVVGTLNLNLNWLLLIALSVKSLKGHAPT